MAKRLPCKEQRPAMNDKLNQLIQEAKHCIGCMHEGTVVTDADDSILEMSPAAERILEAPFASLKATKLRDLYLQPDLYDQLLRQTDSEGGTLNKSVIVLVGDSRRKIVNMSVRRIEHGQQTRYLHVFQDCADLRTMEERLVQAERLATIGRFASQIAHEIRNPLSSISLNVELLEDELKGANPEAQSLIRSVLKQLDRLNDIVGEYLQFSRFPKPHLKRGHVDAVIQGLASSFRPPQNIRFNVQTAPKTPEVWLDEALLRQVLDNLMRNAVEALSGDGTIELETDVLDRFVVIRVKDDGPGIPSDVQGKLFEPFFTTKAHGTGLGLATSQQIIFEH